MFTGIIQAVGELREVLPRAGGISIIVATEGLDFDDVQLGDSIAVNGVCLTVVEQIGKTFRADVSDATLGCTTGLGQLGRVNLEKALRLADRLGGHLVSGHVDGIGNVTLFKRIGESFHLEVSIPKALARFVAAKGSVCINGVSLTTNSVDGEVFSVNLIPHTLAVTTLGDLKIGDAVNIEVDLIARYVDRMRAADN